MEAILASRVRTEYLIKWRNAPIEASTWEPEDALHPDVKAMYNEYGKIFPVLSEADRKNRKRKISSRSDFRTTNGSGGGSSSAPAIGDGSGAGGSNGGGGSSSNKVHKSSRHANLSMDRQRMSSKDGNHMIRLRVDDNNKHSLVTTISAFATFEQLRSQLTKDFAAHFPDISAPVNRILTVDGKEIPMVGVVSSALEDWDQVVVVLSNLIPIRVTFDSGDTIKLMVTPMQKARIEDMSKDELQEFALRQKDLMLQNLRKSQA